MEANTQTISIALAGGIIPSILWLWFWLKEDRAHPEPRGLIILSFLAGMAGVALVFPLEKLALANLPAGVPVIIAWAAIEELVKFGAALLIALKTKFLDEPIDYVIYMITVALGFAGLENALFLMNTAQKSGLADMLATQNMRFIGASLLHVIASSSIGIAMAISFYRGWFSRKLYLFAGIATAILLHTLFNFFIIKGTDIDIFTVFGFVWVVAVIFLLIFEKIKRMSSAY
ncbi:MAG: PrsW family glutamic-type intramembrane protease [Patescibacteria group bacterium]